MGVAFRANGEFVWVGNFACEHEAASRYNDLAKDKLGAFARLNTITIAGTEWVQNPLIAVLN